MNNQKTIFFNEINRNQDRVLLNLKQEHINTYCWIKKEFDKDKNIEKDIEFQRKFKVFYIMNSAGLSDKQKEKFFKLLSNKKSNIKYILSELYKIPRRDGRYSIQFSFATKLIHTVDNTKPIYDRNVAKIINKNVLGINKKEKINSCIEIFDYLNELYLSLIKENEIKKIILKFRKKFKVDNSKISDIKILDFVMWSFGDVILKKGEGAESF